MYDPPLKAGFAFLGSGDGGSSCDDARESLRAHVERAAKSSTVQENGLYP
jgi:hypothetical protein